MHFRLGDYKYKQQYHPVMPPDYYQRALNHLLSKLSTPHIRVLYFCEAEDNDYVTGVIESLRKSVDKSVDWVKADDTLSDWQQLMLMSCCDSHIIANSSFSWWGAWLSGSNDVVAPKKWYGPAALDVKTNDLIPERWKTL